MAKKKAASGATAGDIGVWGVDPGLTGAFVFLEGSIMHFYKMPLNALKEPDFHAVAEILSKHDGHVFLERAIPFAMPSGAAFNYGRGFMVLELAIKLSGLPVTYVEPAKWTKAMHQGISADLKPKNKSVIAVERLYPHFLGVIPKAKTGKLNEGVVDALLIAGFGKRNEILSLPRLTSNDF